MYFNPANNLKGFLEIGDNFAELIEITAPSISSNSDFKNQRIDSCLKFRFSYEISQIKAIQENALSVRITIKKKNRVKNSITQSTKVGSVDTKKLIENILMQKINIINSSKEEKESIILIKESDISSKVNNQILNALKNGDDISELKGLKKSKLVFLNKTENSKFSKNSALEAQVGHSTVEIKDNDVLLKNNLSTTINAKNERLKLLFTKGFASSQITDLSDRTLSIHNASSGTSRKQKAEEYAGDIKTKLLNTHLFEGQRKPESSKDFFASIQDIFDDKITVSTEINIKESVAKTQTTVLVSFELLQLTTKRSGVKETKVIEKVEKDLNIQSYITRFFQPATPPLVKFSKTNQNITFKIRQVDANANFVSVYKRTINNGNLKEKYVKLTSIPATVKGGEANFSVVNLKDNTAIFRFVPSNGLTNFESCEFTDVVVKDSPRVNERSLIIVPSLSKSGEEGIELTAYNNYMPDIVAAKLLVRNATTGKKKFEVVNTFTFSDKQNSPRLKLKKLVPYNVYEFTTILITEMGDEIPSNYTACLEYLPPVGTPLNVVISKPTTVSSSGTSIDVQFSISANVVEDQTKMLRSMLDQLQITDPVGRSTLSDLIAFNVVRYNTMTGDVDDMGIIANNATFSDSVEAGKRGIKTTEIGNSYKYIVYPLVRNPNTVIEKVTDVVDTETKKSYKLNAQKHHHPATLLRGNVVSEHYLKNDPRPEMMKGMLGTSYEVPVSFENKNPRIFDLFVRQENNKNYLTWKVDGDPTLIDHILVTKTINDVRTVVGKSNGFSDRQTFIHVLTKDDIGLMSYLLTPIYLNYASGNNVESSKILIERVN
jgi:hypothetical protein